MTKTIVSWYNPQHHLTIKDGSIVSIEHARGSYDNHTGYVEWYLARFDVTLSEIEYVNIYGGGVKTYDRGQYLTQIDHPADGSCHSDVTYVGRDFVLKCDIRKGYIHFDDPSRYERIGLDWDVIRDDGLRRPEKGEPAQAGDIGGHGRPLRRCSVSELDGILREALSEMDSDEEDLPNWVGVLEHPDIQEPVYIVDRHFVAKDLWKYLRRRFGCAVHVLEVADLMDFFPMAVRCIHFIPDTDIFHGDSELGDEQLAIQLNTHMFFVSKLTESKELLPSYGVEEVWIDLESFYSFRTYRDFTVRQIPLYVKADGKHALDDLAVKLSEVFGFNIALLVMDGCIALHGCVPLYGVEPFFSMDSIESLRGQAQDILYGYTTEDIVGPLTELLKGCPEIASATLSYDGDHPKPHMYLHAYGDGLTDEIILGLRKELRRRFGMQIYLWSIGRADRYFAFPREHKIALDIGGSADCNPETDGQSGKEGS